MNYSNRTQSLLWFSSIIFTGCTTPVAPIVGPEGNSIILYILLLIVFYLLWYIYKNITNSKINTTQNNLNSRLNQIEEDLKNLKIEIKGKNHDKK